MLAIVHMAKDGKPRLEAPIMKTLATALMLSVTLVGASAAYADGMTRDQVNAELQQAKASGQYTFGELDYPPAIQQRSEKSVDQVQAELQQAKADGQYTFGELAYPPKPVAATAGKSRDQVRDELAQAKASGNYTFGELDYPPKAR